MVWINPAMGVLADLALAAGHVILRHFGSGVDVERKSDESPVTAADREAEVIILDGLHRHFPEVAVIAEEASSAGVTPDIGTRFFLVDPLDGTREFIAGRADFTVNIALIEDTRPVMGIVYAPARGIVFAGDSRQGAAVASVEDGRLAAWAPIAVRSMRESGLIAVASLSHADEKTTALVDQMGVSDRVCVGSSLKFCMVARGEADFYPRFSRTMEWDTAAGQAVLCAAGGVMQDIEGRPFRYGKRDQSCDVDFANGGFLAAAHPVLLEKARALITG